MTETAAPVAFDCARLRAIALEQADPAWFEEFPANLVLRMRGSVLGSRLLARALAERPAAVLFAEPVWPMPAQAGWLLWPRAALDELALDLAALALSASIRATVRRDAVLRLRRVLGETRYTAALNEPSGGVGPAGFQTALAADKTLHRYLAVQGHAELVAYAGTLHPACADRVRLSFPPTQAPVQRQLDPLRVAAHLQQLDSVGDPSAPGQVANG
jgi:hypothetical protein